VAGPFELFGYLSEHYMLHNVPAPLIWYFEFHKFPDVPLGFASDIFNPPKLLQFFQKQNTGKKKKRLSVFRMAHSPS